jgi:hypothetical protein
LERLPVYVAWDAGFDFAVSGIARRVPTAMDNIVYNRAMATKAFAVWQQRETDFQTLLQYHHDKMSTRDVRLLRRLTREAARRLRPSTATESNAGDERPMTSGQKRSTDRERPQTGQSQEDGVWEES